MQITQELNKSDIELINKLDGPIVVIGASGFIGANLLSVLCKVRDDVFGTFYSKKGWRLLDFDSEKLIKLDINDENSINEMVKKIYPKIVFNCSSYGAYSFEKDSAKILNTNYNAILLRSAVASVESQAKHSVIRWNCRPFPVHNKVSSWYREWEQTPILV